MKILVFGGSFNPPHLGHFALADHVRSSFDYDKVILVPSFQPPHKVLTDDPGPVHRMTMLFDVCREDDNFLVEDCEIERAGTSYTVDTLEYIIDRYKPEGKPGFLFGDDLVAGFSAWRDPSRIEAMADLIVAGRNKIAALPFPYNHKEAGNALFPISSSLIRERIKKGMTFRYLVPKQVFEYITRKGLYGFH